MLFLNPIAVLVKTPRILRQFSEDSYQSFSSTSFVSSSHVVAAISNLCTCAACGDN